MLYKTSSLPPLPNFCSDRKTVPNHSSVAYKRYVSGSG